MFGSGTTGLITKPQISRFSPSFSSKWFCIRVSKLSSFSFLPSAYDVDWKSCIFLAFYFPLRMCRSPPRWCFSQSCHGDRRKRRVTLMKYNNTSSVELKSKSQTVGRSAGLPCCPISSPLITIKGKTREQMIYCN